MGLFCSGVLLVQRTSTDNTKFFAIHSSHRITDPVQRGDTLIPVKKSYDNYQ